MTDYLLLFICRECSFIHVGPVNSEVFDTITRHSGGCDKEVKEKRDNSGPDCLICSQGITEVSGTQYSLPEGHSLKGRLLCVTPKDFRT